MIVIASPANLKAASWDNVSTPRKKAIIHQVTTHASHF